MTTERTMKKLYGPSGFVAPKPQEERSASEPCAICPNCHTAFDPDWNKNEARSAALHESKEETR